MKLKAHDLGNEHRHRLPKHGRFGLNAADAPTEAAQTVDHGGVRVSSDQGIRIKRGRAWSVGHEDDASQVFKIHLVDDARIGRNDLEVAESALAPAQENVALLVSCKFETRIALKSL